MKLKKYFFFIFFLLICFIIFQKISQYLYQDKLIKILVLFFLFIFFACCLFFYDKHKKILNITIFYFFLILYSLNFLFGFLFYFTSTDYHTKKKFENLKINYDTRSQLEYINVNKSENLFPMITPRDIMQKSDEIVLSNISNSNYVQCNEYGYWKIIRTDKYGYNNNLIKEKYKILISGDSFAHGFCVEDDKELHKILTSNGKETYSIGMAANGPLLSLASMLEIKNKIEFDEIYWLIFRNDFFDLNWELENNKLLNYLNEDYSGEKYFDNLKNKNNIQKKFILENLNKKKNFSYKESFFELKFLNDILKKVSLKKKKTKINQTQFNKILYIFDKKFENKKKTIIFLPNFNCFDNEQALCQKEFKILKNLTINKNINLLNFTNFINQNNYREIFALGLKRSHYSEHGYKELSKIIYELSSD